MIRSSWLVIRDSSIYNQVPRPRSSWPCFASQPHDHELRGRGTYLLKRSLDPCYNSHMTTAYIALGSNLGKREDALLAAITRIAALPHTRVLAQSSFHHTTPVGGPPGQGEYLNAAVAIETELLPRDLLCMLLEIEHNFGRDRATEPRHGPRIIDLDILLYGNQIIDEPHLQLPHPRMHERLFVLAPLAEIAPDVIHPILHVSISTLRDRLQIAPGLPGETVRINNGPVHE